MNQLYQVEGNVSISRGIATLPSGDTLDLQPLASREKKLEETLSNAIVVLKNNARRLTETGRTHHEIDEMVRQAEAALLTK